MLAAAVQRQPGLPAASATTRESIVLGGGCFWCLEAVYELADGVTAVESGYANGQVPNPSYRQVCEGDTGHAEVVRVSFDAGYAADPKNALGTQALLLRLMCTCLRRWWSSSTRPIPAPRSAPSPSC